MIRGISRFNAEPSTGTSITFILEAITMCHMFLKTSSNIGPMACEYHVCRFPEYNSKLADSR